jgi:hypothetical protein
MMSFKELADKIEALDEDAFGSSWVSNTPMTTGLDE